MNKQYVRGPNIKCPCCNTHLDVGYTLELPDGFEEDTEDVWFHVDGLYELKPETKEFLKKLESRN